MSVRATVWAWEVSTRIPNANALLVLLKLADMARDSGKVWPSHRYLAERMPISQRSIRAAIQYLEEIEILRKEPREGMSDVLWLNISATTIFGDGADDDDDFEGGKPRGRPQKTAADSDKTPNKTAARGADEPKKPSKTLDSYNAREAFEEWWAAYPRQEAKGHARKMFWKAATKVTFEVLMEKTREFSNRVMGKERDFIPHPGSWLEAERWNDVVPNGEPTDGYRRDPTTDRARQRAAAIFQPMAAGAQTALDRRRGRWGSL